MFLCVCVVLLSFHMSWADSIIIPFICCQWSFTHRPFHFASSTLSPTMHLNSSHVFSSLSFHTRTLGSIFLCQVFVALNHMSITSSLCFGTHFSLEITLTLWILALCSCRTNTLQSCVQNVQNDLISRNTLIGWHKDYNRPLQSIQHWYNPKLEVINGKFSHTISQTFCQFPDISQVSRQWSP